MLAPKGRRFSCAVQASFLVSALIVAYSDDQRCMAKVNVSARLKARSS